MSTVFVSQEIWPQLTRAVRSSRQACAVAVAYFGKGASSLLPLARGSRLVVDASERAVASGQTCPADLIKLVKRGVTVYSVPNLHAKVFVLGRAAYIGSANASSRSAAQLVEAVIRTTDRKAVRAARKFVHDHCLHELTPDFLKELAKLYRPPLIPGGKKGKRATIGISRHPTLPRLFIAQIRLQDWPEDLERLHDKGLSVAKKRREHPRSFELESFRWSGKCAYRTGDKIVQIIDMGRGKRLATVPANVLYVRADRYKDRQVTFVFVERPVRRRRSVEALARTLGSRALRRLKKSGIVRDPDFAQALLNAWAN